MPGLIGFGRTSPFPFTLGGGPSTLDLLHVSLLDAYAPGWDVEDGAAKNADAYAQALAATFVWIASRRLANQAQPAKMLENLATWETVTRQRPGPRDTAYDRRAAVAAKLRGIAGNTFADIGDACAQLLGPHFVNLLAASPPNEIVFWPGVNPGPPGFEWSTNRCKVRVQVAKGALNAIDFQSLISGLESLLADMCPAWMDFDWATGVGPFIIGQSKLGEAAI